MNTWNRHIHTGTQNVHNVHNAHRNPETQKKPKKLYDFLVQVRNFFYYLWVKRFFDIRREIPSFYADFSICPPPITCGARSEQIRLASPRSQSQLTNFSQISAHASGARRHSHPWSHLLSGIFIVTSLNDTSAPCAREHLRSCLHLTNPCTEPKGSQPN